jgi:hypothetical protein
MCPQGTASSNQGQQGPRGRHKADAASNEGCPLQLIAARGGPAAQRAPRREPNRRQEARGAVRRDQPRQQTKIAIWHQPQVVASSLRMVSWVPSSQIENHVVQDHRALRRAAEQDPLSAFQCSRRGADEPPRRRRAPERAACVGTEGRRRGCAAPARTAPGHWAGRRRGGRLHINRPAACGTAVRPQREPQVRVWTDKR